MSDHQAWLEAPYQDCYDQEEEERQAKIHARIQKMNFERRLKQIAKRMGLQLPNQQHLIPKEPHK